MPILDQVTVEGETAEYCACEIRGAMLRIVGHAEGQLAAIVSLIGMYDRAQIDAVLGGSDATELTTLYNSIKTMLESAEVGKTIPAIPV